MSLRCLIVDDSPAFLEAARALLERQGLTVVGTASNSRQALQQAVRLRPDVALVDIELNGESGLDVARRLQLEDTTRSLPVILISTHSKEDYEELIAAGPAVGFVPKISLSAAAIRQALDGYSGSRPDPSNRPEER